MKWSPRIMRWVLGVGVVMGCGSDDPPPGSGAAATAAVGAWCAQPAQCSTYYCCASPQCGHGMCTYACRDDRECPYGTRCADGACFWICASDRECAVGQTCKHARTVCQY